MCGLVGFDAVCFNTAFIFSYKLDVMLHLEAVAEV